MRKFIAGLVFILAITLASHSQTTSIKGTVTDTVEKKNLSNAVVTLLRNQIRPWLNLHEPMQMENLLSLIFLPALILS